MQIPVGLPQYLAAGDLENGGVDETVAVSRGAIRATLEKFLWVESEQDVMVVEETQRQVRGIRAASHGGEVLVADQGKIKPLRRDGGCWLWTRLSEGYAERRADKEHKKCSFRGEVKPSVKDNVQGQRRPQSVRFADKALGYTPVATLSSQAPAWWLLESFVRLPCARFPSDSSPSIPLATRRREILDNRPAG